MTQLGLYIIIYYPGVQKTTNSFSVASNKYSKPAENKKVMNIQQQSFILEMARYGLGQGEMEGVFVCAKGDKGHSLYFIFLYTLSACVVTGLLFSFPLTKDGTG